VTFPRQHISRQMPPADRRRADMNFPFSEGRFPKLISRHVKRPTLLHDNYTPFVYVRMPDVKGFGAQQEVHHCLFRPTPSDRSYSKDFNDAGGRHTNSKPLTLYSSRELGWLFVWLSTPPARLLIIGSARRSLFRRAPAFCRSPSHT